MPTTYLAIVCPHKHPKAGLRVIRAFTIAVEATPKYVQERARKCLAGMLIDPDDAATMRIVPCKGSTHAAIREEPDRSCEMRDGVLRVIRRVEERGTTKSELLANLSRWARSNLSDEQQAVIRNFIKRMRTL